MTKTFTIKLHIAYCNNLIELNSNQENIEKQKPRKLLGKRNFMKKKIIRYKS